MKNKGPGSKIADLAITRFQEEEARRRRLLDLALGPHDILQQAKAANRFLEEAGGAARIAEQFAQSRRLYEEFGQQQFAMAESLKSLVDFPTLRLAQDAARQWSQLQSPFVEAAKSISTSVKAMTETLQSSLAQLAVPLSTISAAHEAFLTTERQLREGMRPLQSMVEQIGRQHAEVLRMVQGSDWQQLQGTIEAVRRDFALHAETGQLVLAGTDVQLAVTRVLDGLSPDHPPDASTIAMLLGLLLAVLQHIVDATSKEVRSIGLVGAFMIIATIKSLEPSYTAEDRRTATETHQLVERLESDLNNVAEAEAQEHAYVEALSKAVVTGAGRVREQPLGTSKITTKLPRDTVVGIIEKQGRWRRVLFRDELTHDLADGWMYAGSLESL
jgi:CRISPR/Cas system CSM-associated protein Csm2 small subunit